MQLLEQLSKLWLSKLELARKHKDEVFQDTADEAMRFYHRAHDFVFLPFGQRSGRNFIHEVEPPRFKITINKVAELVELFLPVLLHRNPVRTVTPRSPAFSPDMLGLGAEDPLVAQLGLGGPTPYDNATAKLLQWVLNWLPHVTGLKGESRQALIEALVKGRGILWTETFRGPQGVLVGSFYDSVDNLLLDPDARRMRDVKWAARLRRRPVWDVERRYKIPRHLLKPNMESVSRRAQVNSDPGGDYERKMGHTNDLVEYYEIFSRMGIGGDLADAPEDSRDLLRQFGDAVYLVVADGVPFPLNLPDEVARSSQNPDEIAARLRWPTPFHQKIVNPWPFVPLDFHEVPEQIWPMAHIAPAMGEQEFLDWGYSFLMSKVQTTCRDFVAAVDGLGEEVKDQLLNGPDLSLLEIKHKGGKNIQELIQWLQHPPMNKDIFTILQMVEQNFEKRTGLAELMYGAQSKVSRSATDVNVRREMLSIRPDDMAEQVENWMGLVAENEAAAISAHLGIADVAPAFGETFSLGDETGAPPYTGMMTRLWHELVASKDLNQIMSGYQYTIEAGSARKPNKQRDIENIDESAQVIFPSLMQAYQQTGDPSSANAWLSEWARSRDMDASKFQLPDLRAQMAAAQAAQQQQPQQRAA